MAQPICADLVGLEPPLVHWRAGGFGHERAPSTTARTEPPDRDPDPGMWRHGDGDGVEASNQKDDLVPSQAGAIAR